MTRIEVEGDYVVPYLALVSYSSDTSSYSPPILTVNWQAFEVYSGGTRRHPLSYREVFEDTYSRLHALAGVGEKYSKHKPEVRFVTGTGGSCQQIRLSEDGQVKQIISSKCISPTLVGNMVMLLSAKESQYFQPGACLYQYSY